MHLSPVRIQALKALGNCRDHTAVSAGGNDFKAHALCTETLPPNFVHLVFLGSTWETTSISRLNISPDIKYSIYFDIGHYLCTPKGICLRGESPYFENHPHVPSIN